VLEDPAPERTAVPQQPRRVAAAIAGVETNHREVSDDRDEPGGEPGPMFRLVDPGSQPPEVVRTHRLARARKTSITSS